MPYRALRAPGCARGRYPLPIRGSICRISYPEAPNMAWRPTAIVTPTNLNRISQGYRRIDVRPLAGALGAEIFAVDLSDGMDDDTFAEVHQALLDHLVIFFRDQELSPDQHSAFGRRFGDFHEHAFVGGVDGHPEIMRVVKKKSDTLNFGGVWHSDVTFEEEPPLGSVLYAKQVPEYGGDTLFANMYLAYETLSDGMKQMLDGLRAVHSAKQVYGPNGIYATKQYAEGSSTAINPTEMAVNEVDHPVVRRHPETGRHLLFVNAPFTIGFKNMSEEESAPLLHYLVEHSTRPEFTCRHRWTKGSLAFWDNRCTQHCALNDYQGQSRIMHRVTIKGDRPI